MAISLVTKFSKYVDEVYAAESKASLVTNNFFEFTGANTVKVWKVGAADMNDYNRAGTDNGSVSRYGKIQTLDASTQDMTMEKDRSFTFEIDKLDRDETGDVLNGADALQRQIRLKVIPETDARTYSKMATGAGTKPTALALTASNIYDEIIKGTLVLDDAEIPETERVLIVTPTVYYLMKKSSDIILETETGADMKLKGVIGNLDGMSVVKIPASRLPENFGFMIAHPSATVAPCKLEEYRIHQDPPFLSGELVEGRVVYDAFVLENKAMGIYYQAVTA